MTDRPLQFIGLCKRAGALVVGEESVGAAQRSGKAKLLLVASDASDGTVRRVQGYASDKIPLIALPYTKDTLGDMLGKRVCAVLAVTDKAMAKALIEKIQNSEFRVQN